MAETLRTPPALGPRLSKPGTLMVDYDVRVAEPLLDTYSPFPTFGSGDPLGLNAFLLHPSDPTFDYLLTRPIPGELLPADQQAKVPPGLFSQPLAPSLQPPLSHSKDARRKSPLALECKPEEDDEDQNAENGGVISRLRPVSVGNSLRAIIGRKSTTAAESESPVEEDATYSRSESVSSALSSGSSTDGSDGLRTPRDSTLHSPDETSTAAAKLAAALADDDERRPKSASWRNWLGSKNSSNGKRASFLPFRGDDSTNPDEIGTTPHVSPRANGAELSTDQAFSEAFSRSAIRLRRVSLNKLGSLRMTSPHPLAVVLLRQQANLPNEIAHSIHYSKRVFPLSVNAHQGDRSELRPSEGGFRIVLAVRNIIAKLDAGERPPELSTAIPRQGSRNENRLRPRGVRDFVRRKPYEERMLEYLPDGTCSQISMARSGFAIEELEFSDHIIALMKSQNAQSSSSTQAPAQRSTLGNSRSQSADNLSTQPLAQNRLLTKPAAVEGGRPVSSFRSAMKPSPSTWEDSSGDEEEDDVPPSRPVALRSQTAPARVANKNAGNRVSRVMDAQTALEAVTKARERRQDFNSGNVERRQVGADITREQRRKSMMVGSVSTSSLDKKSGRALPGQRSSTVATAEPLAHLPTTDRTSRNPKARASSATLATRARENAHADAAAKLSGSKTGHSDRRPRSPAPSLPSGSQLRSQDGRRVVSQLEPSLRARQSTMTLGMYPMPMAPVPAVAMYGSPMMGQPVMFAPVVNMQPNPVTMYSAPYGSGVPNMPNYRPRPPATGRRRERPVT